MLGKKKNIRRCGPNTTIMVDQSFVKHRETYQVGHLGWFSAMPMRWAQAMFRLRHGQVRRMVDPGFPDPLDICWTLIPLMLMVSSATLQIAGFRGVYQGRCRGFILNMLKLPVWGVIIHQKTSLVIQFSPVERRHCPEQRNHKSYIQKAEKQRQRNGHALLEERQQKT